MNFLRTALCLTVGVLFATSASAQNMKPGLWESNSKMGGNPEMEKAMAMMQQQMASMTPAQRKQMESVMGKQGIQFGSGGVMTKMCITQAMIDQGQLERQQQGNCKTTISDKSSSGMKMNFSCTDPASTGQAVYTFQGDKGYTMNMKITTSAKGVPSVTTMESTGKWLGSDCGEVKPITLPKAP